MSTPETFYREAIDLNRYSNQVARQIVTNYNNVILDLTNKLATIDEVTAPATVARIRAMLVQMKESLESWSKKQMERTEKVEKELVNNLNNRSTKTDGRNRDI